MTCGEYGYKIDQLERMLKSETNPDPAIGGFGAQLRLPVDPSIKGILLDADALRCLIKHYKRRNKEVF